MALGGGKFTNFNKRLPGTYTRVITVGSPKAVVDSGIVAGGIVSDWAPDDEIFQIDVDKFVADPVAVTGYSYDHDKNQTLRELFKHANTLMAYKLNTGGTKAKSEGVGEAKYSGSIGNGITVSVLKNIVDESKYDVTTYLNGEERDKQTVAELSIDEITLTKGQEKAGQTVKPTFIDKYGFVPNKEELNDIPGLSTTGIDHLTKNVFYFQFADSLTNGEEYAAIFEVENKKYALPLWNLSEGHKNCYLALGDNLSGSFINEGSEWKANTNTVDVTGKTVKVSLYYYGKKADLAAIKAEPTEKILDGVSFNCSNSVAKDEVQTGTAAKAAFAFDKNTATVTFSDIPEGYVHSVSVKKQGETVKFAPGKLEDKVSGLTHTVTYNTGADTDGQMTIEAVLTKDKPTVINSCTYTCQLDEGVQVGANGSKLYDNDFVIFEDGVIEMNAGYAFTGGNSGSVVTAADHSAFLAKLEGYSFNDLYYDGDVDEIKELYVQYTKRLRDTRGIYFQTILFNYPDADYEGIVSIYNNVENATETQTLTPWTAGYMSAIALNNEATNKEYDGELDVFTDITQARLETLLDSGNFVFHNISLDEVRTLEDVNTFRSFTDDKNEDISQNKVIRIVDRIHNALASLMNRLDVGTVSNTTVGHNTLWVRVDAILAELVNMGAIEAYDPSDIEVLAIEGQRDAIQINLNIRVAGTIRRIYITTYVLR